MSDEFYKGVTFTASETAQIVGMNPETLRVWRRRKNITLEGEREGWTRFTYNDVMLITAYHRLTQSFCTSSLAETVSSRIVEELKDDWRSGLNSRKPIYCLVQGSGEASNIRVKIVRGRQDLSKEMSEVLRSPELGPVYQLVDCSQLFRNCNRKITNVKLIAHLMTMRQGD